MDKIYLLFNFKKKLKLQLIISIGMFLSFSNIHALPPSSLEIKWTTPSEQLNTVRSALNNDQLKVKADPSSIDETKGLPLLYVISGVILIPQFAKAVIDVYKDFKYGQVIITQDSSGIVSILHDPKSSNHTVIFIDSKNNISFHENITTLDPNRLLELLIAALSK